MALVSGFTATPNGAGATWMVAVTLKQLAAIAGDGDAAAAPAMGTSVVVAMVSRPMARQCSFMTSCFLHRWRGRARPAAFRRGRCPLGYALVCPYVKRNAPRSPIGRGRGRDMPSPPGDPPRKCAEPH